ncbi:LysE family translocator [Phyllobacterium salinisoli]|uniref:LysE family translocator n=1 Tax=Phyllobacterium salinisoli TaxID=1899321 RepID=A0A368K990_9HYPH|nr:LysE family translocator [Phyllobacterium salinisoli]RCS24650.1 LysE family translocator [Phyllobacterium salinisoli]
MEAIIHYLPDLLLAYTICGLSILSPGPNVLAVMGTSMGEGRRQGKALAWGISSGSFLWALMAWAGLIAVIAAYAAVLVAIKIAGGVYLLWLAIKAFRSAAQATEPIARTFRGAKDLRAFFLRGLTIQMTNPKTAFSWIAIMSLGLDANAPLWVGLAIVFGTILISAVGHQVYAVVFSTQPMITAYRRGRRWIQVSLGAFFCFASFKLLTAKT